MSCCALVPVKAPGHCKQRLAGVLDPDERHRLVRLMLEDVLAALRRCPAVDCIALTAPERPDPALGELLWLPDTSNNLNGAVSQASASLEARGVTELLVLHADLPLLGAEDIGRLVATGRQSGIALAPDRAGQGTNAIYLGLPSRFAFRFGTGSLSRHRTEASQCGIAPDVLSLPGLNFDVDDPADLEVLLDRRGHRYEFLQSVLRSIE